MATLNRKVEFYGGPRDGEILYKKTTDIPTDILEDLNDDSREKMADRLYHHYMIQEEPNHKFKYRYQGIVFGS